MPIEIRELLIRARVSEPSQRATLPGEGSDSATQSRPRSAAPDDEELVERCVREVLRILEELGER